MAEWYEERQVKGFPDGLWVGHVITFAPRWDLDTERDGFWLIIGFQYDKKLRAQMECLNLKAFGLPSAPWQVRSGLKPRLILHIDELTETEDGGPPYERIGVWNPHALQVDWVKDVT